MPPQQRMTCMLRAVGRAARADALAPALDAVACAAFGPLTLSLLTVRFLRRLELLDEVASSRLQSYMLKAATPCARGCNPTSAPTGTNRPHVHSPMCVPCVQVTAGVLLCQGLVMAWLAARRKMLPDEVRRRGNPRFGIAFPVASVHVANLYMRCTADLLILNSACGQPLRLLGAWQWFDSILFHGMLDAARRGGAGASWQTLLRGDAQLLQVFELLLPLALATERKLATDEAGASAAAAARLVRAAGHWQQMHPSSASSAESPRAGALRDARREQPGWKLPRAS